MKRRSAAEKQAMERFRVAVLAKGKCLFGPEGCNFWPTGECEAHHVIKRQTLEAHVSTLPDQDRFALVWNPSLGVPMCNLHHQQITSGFRPLALEEVPEDVREFCTASQITHLLERACPPLASVLFGREAA